MESEVVVTQAGRQAIHLIVRETLVLGRECEGLLLADPQVSRRHLEIRPRETGVLCTDLGSTNGSFLNGERFSAPIVLLPGSILTIGETSIRVASPVGPNSDQRRTTMVGSAPSTSEEFDMRRTSIDVVAELVTTDAWTPDEDAGTITILFSDIESHTEQVNRVGDAAWFTMLEHHNRVFRDELALTGGREIKAQGDGFMLTFNSVRRALNFAANVQQRLREHAESDPDAALRVRMGLHTGEVITDATGDVFGRHVIKAARIANMAAGGQVLVSGTVREIAAGDHDFQFGDATPVELKGLDGQHNVHDLHWQSP